MFLTSFDTINELINIDFKRLKSSPICQTSTYNIAK